MLKAEYKVYPWMYINKSIYQKC